MDLLSIFFPKKCVNCKEFGDYLCPNCFALLDFTVPLICAVCGKQAVGGLTHPTCKGRYDIDGVFASLVYRSVAKKLIYQFKFQPYLKDLQHVMGELFYEGIIQREEFFNVPKERVLLSPIPLSRQRERKRGYNQAMILAGGLGRRLNLPVKSFIIRIKQASSQVGKTQQERWENVKGAFAVEESDKQLLKGKTIFLIDDVVTSGATMNEAAKMLKRAGAKRVYGLAFAHGI